MSVRKLHRSSAVIIVAFALFHIVNHLFAIGGAERHIAVMDALRLIYRNVLVEAVLLCAVVFQALTGLRLFWFGRNKRTRLLDKLQAFSGLYLAVFFIIHVSSVLVERNAVGLDSNFYFAAAGLLKFPSSLFFVPYYSLSIIAIFTHLGCALRWMIMDEYSEISANRAAYLMIALGVVTSIIIFVAFSGWLYQINLPQQYR